MLVAGNVETGADNGASGSSSIGEYAWIGDLVGELAGAAADITQSVLAPDPVAPPAPVNIQTGGVPGPPGASAQTDWMPWLLGGGVALAAVFLLLR